MTYLAIARSVLTGYEKDEKNEKTPVPERPSPGDGIECENERNESNEKSPAVLSDTADMVPQLESGWDWLASHPTHAEHEAFLVRWIARLREYERAFARQWEPPAVH